MFFGGGALLVVFAFHIVWIARSAHSRNRSVFASMCIAFGAGALGLLVGREFFLYATSGKDPSNAALLIGVLALPVATFAPLAAIAMGISRMPVRVSRARDWSVHVIDRGPGSIHIGADFVRLAWSDETRVIPMAELRGSAADGECVRLTTASGDSYALLANGDYREVRIAKSKALAAALVAIARN